MKTLVGRAMAVGAGWRVSLAVRSWWLQRSGSERILLASILSLLGIWGLWAALLAPSSDWRFAQERDASAWERRLEWLEMHPRQALPGELRPSLLTASVGDCELQFLRLNQDDTSIQVTLQEQSFACVLDWLMQVEGDHGIEVDQLRLQAGQWPGSVNGTLRFRAS